MATLPTPIHPYDPRLHAPGSIAASGRCSQHGTDVCDLKPVMSFTDALGRRQSGCFRVLEAMLDRSQLDANWNLR